VFRSICKGIKFEQRYQQITFDPYGRFIVISDNILNKCRKKETMPGSYNTCSLPKGDLSSLTLKYAIGVVVVILVLSFIAKFSENEAKKYSPRFIKHIKNLVKYAAQWSTVAKQDENPLIALMHVNTALSYAYIARRLVPSKEVAKIANVNLDELIYVLEEEQMEAMQKINQYCPELQPEGVFAAYTGWLG
jgi:hypothetical protein